MEMLSTLHVDPCVLCRGGHRCCRAHHCTPRSHHGLQCQPESHITPPPPPPPRRAGYRRQHPWGPHTPFEGLVVIAHALTLKEGQRHMPFDIPPPRVLSDPSFDLKPTIMAAAHTIGLATSMV
jgi:hypothetical protein